MKKKSYFSIHRLAAFPRMCTGTTVLHVFLCVAVLKGSGVDYRCIVTFVVHSYT